MKLSRIVELHGEGRNLAEHLDEDVLGVIGGEVVEGYGIDLDSRRDWEEKNAEALKIAMQVYERKTFPWPGASNVKYPLVAITCMQFNARAYPSLVPDRNIVGVNTRPGSPLELVHQATLVAEDMNWEIMDQSTEWEDGHDLLLMVLPLIGTVFKKTYFDAEKGTNCSYPVHPSHYVVHYWAKRDRPPERGTHVLYYSKNELQEQMRLGYYREVDIQPQEVALSESERVSDEAKGFVRPADPEQVVCLEQHTWIDMDDDGYEEPYVVTCSLDGKVLRLIPRFKRITVKGRGGPVSVDPYEFVEIPGYRVARIEAEEYFTKYGFIRSPDGSYYDIGLGALLTPLNKAVDAVLNQLIDAGTLANASGGLLARGVRHRSGPISVSPGKFIRTDADPESLHKGFLPWPVKDPSQVLFQLLGAMLEAGQRLSSVSETMSGQNPGQNQAATTTMTVLEQGLQVFSSIYKRIWRSMSEEFRRWYDLNARYSTRRELYALPSHVISPTADPSAVSHTQRLLKAQALMERVQIAPHLYGLGGQVEAERRFLKALGIPGGESLLSENPQPPVNPEAEAMKREQDREDQKFQLDAQIAMSKEQRETERTRSNVLKDMASIETKYMTAGTNAEKAAWQRVKDQLDHELATMDLVLKAKEIEVDAEQQRMA